MSDLPSNARTPEGELQSRPLDSSLAGPREPLDLAAFERVLAQTKLRLRAARALRGLLLGIALVTSTMILWPALAASPLPASDVALLTTLLALAPALLAACLPVPSTWAARLLDRSQDGHERALSGIEFLCLPVAQRSPFMEAHLRDLAMRAQGWSAGRAVPLRRPPELAWLLVPLALSLVSLFVQPAGKPLAKSRLQTQSRSPTISQDDLSAFQRELRELEVRQKGALESGDEVRAFNELLERLATGELSRTSGIRALLSLERKLLEGSPKPTDADSEQLRELADDMARASETMAKALRAGDPDAAARELRAVAQRAQGDEAAREQLKKALEKERARQRSEEASETREKELDGLLRKPRDAVAESPGERSLFERRRRELEQLRRENSERRARSRHLERLSRDLARAADALDRSSPSEAEREQSEEAQPALEEAARDLERFAEQNRAGNAAEELAREASQLRELLQRQGAQQSGQQNARNDSQGNSGGGNSEREARQQRFVLKARGESEERQLSLRPGQAGEQSHQGQGRNEGNQPGENNQPGQGQPGEQVQVLTPGGGTAGQDSQRIDLLLPSGAGTTRTVSQAGSERGAPPFENPTSLKANHTDSTVAGTPGKGPTRSQIILDAADRGFRTTPYHKVYADYRAHAESVIEHDQVPAGHRFYVRRYFQLIRPRDE